MFYSEAENKNIKISNTQKDKIHNDWHHQACQETEEYN